MKLQNDEEIDLLTKIILLFSTIVGSVEKQSEHFDEIKKLINYIYQLDSWSILRLDEASNQLFFTVIEGEAGQLLKPIPIKLGEGVCGQVALTGTAQILVFSDEKPEFTKSVDKVTDFQTKTMVVVPIIYDNKILGVLELINVDNPEIFKLSIHMNLLQTIANLIGMIFSLSNTHQEIIKTSERDILTGLCNRTRLDKFTTQKNSIYQANNNEEKLIVIMIDVDNFKAVNDNYGHRVGDLLLKDIARLLYQTFRKDDLIIRYGGDEFIIIISLKENDDEITIQKLADSKLNDLSRSLPYLCSLSYGISCGNKLNFNELLDEADKLMYITKRQKIVR